MSERLLVDLDEAADQLSISRRSLQGLIFDGALGSVKVGRRRLVATADLRLYVEGLREENKNDREAWKPAIVTEGNQSARRRA